MNGKSAVYSCKEKILLAQLVKESENIIENKRTDGTTLVEKKRAWECISNTYNSQPEVNTLRTAEQLKKLWNNLKQRKRKDTTALRYSMLATGGGPIEKPKSDVVLDFVELAAPHLDVSVDCPWDSLHVFEEQQTEAKNQSEETADNAKVQLQLPAFEDIPDPYLLPSTSKVIDKKSIFNTCHVTTAASAAPEQAKTKVQPRIGTPKRTLVLTENSLRENKLVEATQQQQELHTLKKKIIEEDLLRVKLEVQRAELQKQAAEFDRQRASDEAELASLKLKQFRKRMLSEDL